MNCFRKFVTSAAILVSSLLLAGGARSEVLSVGHADENIRALHQKVKLNPNDADAYGTLCRVYFLVDDWESSIANGERSVQLRPNVAVYHLWLGRAYGRKAEAANPLIAFTLARKVVREFERAYQLEPANWDIRRDLAEFYVEAPAIVGGGERKAEQLAGETQAKDPVGASLIRGMIATKKKNWAEAERQYKAAVEHSGGAAGAWLELARHYRNGQRWNDFAAAVRHALDSPKRSPGDLFDAGELLCNTGRMLPQAADALRTYLRGEAMDDYGTAFRAHYLLGQVLEKEGDRQGAAGEYRSALALASKYQPAQDALRRLGS
jgi:tetratricopeptide (TPR) repeat protein